jgi:hypothetical protein
VITRTFPAGTVPGFYLSDMEGLPVLDGLYTYRLLVVPGEKINMQDREKGEISTDKNGALFTDRIAQTGYFTVKNGAIVLDLIEPQASRVKQDGISGTKDQVINDDLIVTFSACIGNDCVNGESFGFDTLRLKENNLRIRAYDTSNTASFPTRDWQITFNETSNGGANKFSIDDIDGGRTPFTIEGGAPTDSLYIEDDGQIGIGTSTPVADLHVVNGNTPTLRLQQDGSSGFTPQTWDVAGNEANFFIRDVTNGSPLPFRIAPGSGTGNAIYIAADGKIGLGTTSPGYQLHQYRTGGTKAQFAAEYAGGALTLLAAKADAGIISTLNGFPLRFSVNNNQAMDLLDPEDATNTNHLEMRNGARCDKNGNWLNNSTREAKENIVGLNAGEALNALQELEPVTYNYKKDKNNSYAGFIAEDVPELVATKSRKQLSPMDIVAVLTKVTQEQQKLLKSHQETVQLQQQTIEAMKQRLAELEKQLKKK